MSALSFIKQRKNIDRGRKLYCGVCVCEREKEEAIKQNKGSK